MLRLGMSSQAGLTIVTDLSKMTHDFFEEQEEQSAVKTAFVVKYLPAWARIMVQRAGAHQIAYLDLFSGPGRFSDGTPSTPILLIEEAIKQPLLRDHLLARFSDENGSFVRNLQTELSTLRGISTMRFQPTVRQHALNSDQSPQFDIAVHTPSLSFIDPWGYKGVTRDLIAQLVRNFGCEIILFFNFNRINAAIANNLVEPHMEALFGESKLLELRRTLVNLVPTAREKVLMRALGDVLEEMGAPYLIPFRFARSSGRASHYICFVSKHPLGYAIMKDIMASLGVKDADGVPRFEYVPQRPEYQLEFDIDRPIQALPRDLLTRFRNRTLRVSDIISEHNIGTPFVPANYRRVLLELETAGLICCDPPNGSRRKGTMAENVSVTFL